MKYLKSLTFVLLSFFLIPQVTYASDEAIVFDIDADGEVKALTDGLMTIRYLFGFRGEALIDSAIGDNATRVTAPAIESYLSEHINDLDIDGNTDIQALTDGLLQLRYLFGFRGTALTQNAIGNNATRITVADIETYIGTSILPTLNNPDSGVWTFVDATDNTLIALVFLDDGTYVFMQVDDDAPTGDPEDNILGMELGTYSRDSVTGELTVTQTFDGNGTKGFSHHFNRFTSVTGDTLTLQVEENQGDPLASFEFERQESTGLLGLWTNNQTDDDFLALAFFDNGTYVHMQIGNSIPSGMELGTYFLNSLTGQLIIPQIIFDGNEDIGFTSFVGASASSIFAQVSGDTLTMQFNESRNGTIESDELEFQRQ